MHLLAAQRHRVVDRLAHGLLKLARRGPDRTQPAVAGIEVPGRHVEQHHLETILADDLGELVLVVSVGKQELDALEPSPRRGAEAVQEVHLVEHHGQVGVELRHGLLRS